jgi:hypothetical protein
MGVLRSDEFLLCPCALGRSASQCCRLFFATQQAHGIADTARKKGPPRWLPVTHFPDYPGGFNGSTQHSTRPQFAAKTKAKTTG